MKRTSIVAFLVACMALVACDESTLDFGQTVTDRNDQLTSTVQSFTVNSRSLIVDSVLTRNSIAYLGRVRDPETGSYVTGNAMVQFGTLANPGLPEVKDSIKSRDTDGDISSVLCYMELFYDNFYGDSIANMKLRATELAKPMNEDRYYYSNFDPKKEGYLRDGGLKVEKSYTLADQAVSDSMKATTNYLASIRIPLNDEYTAPDGKKYNNIGTYLMRKYYEDPKSFSSNYRFINNVLPGFYFENTGGLGSMANVNISWLQVYYTGSDSQKVTGSNGVERDSVYRYLGYASFAGTEEVLQTSNVTYDAASMQRLSTEEDGTYIKSPAGIFTEITIPVEEVVSGHDGDSISQARLSIPRINNRYAGDYKFDVPATLLMLPKSRLYTFFENKELPDNRTAFLSSFNANSDNTYTFSNISNLISYMRQHKGEPDWNKVVLIPVTTSTTTVNTSTVISKVVHDMSLNSTKLVGGEGGKLTLEVVYSHFAK